MDQIAWTAIGVNSNEMIIINLFWITGNSSFNLTSKNTIYSSDYLKKLNLKKKCSVCLPNFTFEKDGN